MKFNRIEFGLKLNRNEFELKLNWKRTESELKIDLNWNQLEIKLKWIYIEKFDFDLNWESEVEIVLKTNLKWFIKYVLKGNRRNIYNINIIYI